MNANETITIPEGSLDLDEQISTITSSLSETLAPFILFSLAITAVFIVLYIFSLVRRRKLENALLDIQKMLHEMNERDKTRQTSLLSPRKSDDRIIAASDSDNNP